MGIELDRQLNKGDQALSRFMVVLGGLATAYRAALDHHTTLSLEIAEGLTVSKNLTTLGIFISLANILYHGILEEPGEPKPSFWPKAIWKTAVGVARTAAIIEAPRIIAQTSLDSLNDVPISPFGWVLAVGVTSVFAYEGAKMALYAKKQMDKLSGKSATKEIDSKPDTIAGPIHLSETALENAIAALGDSSLSSEEAREKLKRAFTPRR